MRAVTTSPHPFSLGSRNLDNRYSSYRSFEMLFYVHQVPSLDRLDKLFTGAHDATEKLLKSVEEIYQAPSEVGELTNRYMQQYLLNSLSTGHACHGKHSTIQF